MSSYFFTSSLNRVASNIKKTVNELINGNSIEDESRDEFGGLDYLKRLNDGNGNAIVDIITSRARKVSKPDNKENLLTEQTQSDSNRPVKRLSLAEIFGGDTTLSPSSSENSSNDLASSVDPLNETINLPPKAISDTSQGMSLLEVGMRKLPSLSTLPEEDDSEKSTDNSIPRVDSPSHQSENLTNLDSPTEMSEKPDMDKFESDQLVKSADGFKETPDTAEAVGL